jgi:sporulation protein YlmC with PRC-barrel domain
MRTMTLLLGAALAVAVSLAPKTALVQTTAAPDQGATQAAASYGSYLAMPAQENAMLRDGLDADELIGAEVVAADGTRIGAVTDLLVDADGAITHAAVDAGQALGMGSRTVAVDLAKLRRSEAGPSTFLLETDGLDLDRMAAYRQAGDRWDRAQ